MCLGDCPYEFWEQVLATNPTGVQWAGKGAIHNSDYELVEACKTAIDRHFRERNEHFEKNPRRVGNRIWGKERTKAEFRVSKNGKDSNSTW